MPVSDKSYRLWYVVWDLGT